MNEENKLSRRERISSVSFGLALVIIAVLVAAIYFNPLSYFADASMASYYQARIAYQRGDGATKSEIIEAFADQKITQNEYSNIIFPAFLKVVNDGEALLPSVEMMKGRDLLICELADAMGIELKK